MIITKHFVKSKIKFLKFNILNKKLNCRIVMNKLRAWLIAARLFALPMVFVDTFFGMALAGVNIWTWLLAFLITSSLLIATEFINLWRDYVSGYDKLKGGSRVKPYTSATLLLPKAILTVKDMKIGASVMILFSLFLMYFVPWRLDTWSLYALGLFCALTYTDFWKRKGLGEVPVFLGPGMGIIAFAYALVKSLDITGLTGAVVLGLWGPLFYTLDQYSDVKNSAAEEDKKNLAYMLKIAKTSLSSYVWSSGLFILVALIGAVVAKLLPEPVLAALLVLPVIRIGGTIMDSSYEKGIQQVLIAKVLFSLIPAIALLICGR